MNPPETSTDATTSQPNVNNSDLQAIQQALSSLNTGAPRIGLPLFRHSTPIKIVQLLGNPTLEKIDQLISNLLISLREFDSKVKRGLLLTYVGEATNDIFDTLPEAGDDYI